MACFTIEIIVDEEDEGEIASFRRDAMKAFGGLINLGWPIEFFSIERDDEARFEAIPTLHDGPTVTLADHPSTGFVESTFHSKANLPPWRSSF